MCDYLRKLDICWWGKYMLDSGHLPPEVFSCRNYCPGAGMVSPSSVWPLICVMTAFPFSIVYTAYSRNLLTIILPSRERVSVMVECDCPLKPSDMS